MKSSPTRMVVVAAFATTAIALPAGAEEPNANSARSEVAVKTRLVHGPVVFRRPASEGSGRLDYFVVFKLNRDPLASLSSDPDAPVTPADDVEIPTYYSRGDYSLNRTVTFEEDLIIGPMYGRRAPGTKKYCFFTIFPVGYSKSLDARPTGTRVDMRLQPLDRLADGTSKLGSVFRRRPRIQLTNRSMSDPIGRANLRRIGCSKPTRSGR